jgi:hypothetical protein
MIRATIIGLSGAVLVSFSVAADPQLCKIIQQNTSSDFYGLYYQVDAKSAWQALENFTLGEQTSLPRRNVRFVFVINPSPTRSGVVNVRLRTEAVGTQPDAAIVNVERSAVNEPCGPRGWRYRLRAFSYEIPTSIYESYHDPNKHVDYSYLDRFHFSYKPDQGDCVSTKSQNRVSYFRFSSIPSDLPTEIGPGDIARAVSPPELNTAVAALSHGIATAAAEVIPGASLHEATPVPHPTHYTKLASLLQKYDARGSGQDCIGFSILPSRNEVKSYISITDFDASSSFSSSYFSEHWQINWQTP